MTGAILDLNGATITLALDTTYTFYQVTDTSPAHDGHLAMEAGAILEFDDSLNAGFSPVATAIDIRINGTAVTNCLIQSTDSYPDHRWMLPPETVAMNATECIFRNYSGTFAPAWELQNCETTLDPFVYCSVAQLVMLTGTELAEDVLREIVGQATNEINARLALGGIAIEDASDVTLRAICLNKSIAGVLTRYRLDGTRAGSANVDGIATGDNIGSAISQYEEKAEMMLATYIKTHVPSDQEMTFFQILNRSE